MRVVKRKWRKYKTEAGNCPVDNYMDKLSDEDLASVLAGMLEVRQQGLAAARHLRGEIYEVRVDGEDVAYRVVFAPQGSRKQILLALVAFKKTTRKTPPATIALAKRRLRDWERRSRAPKKGGTR